MAREAIVQPQPEAAKDRDTALRPRWLREVIGQKSVVRRLSVVLNACKKVQRADGSYPLRWCTPGLGKTTFATVLPNELGTSLQMTSGPALSKPADLVPFLTNAEEGSILFIDEIHRMPRVVEEFIYPAMEDFRMDIVLGEGVNARTISLNLKHFTLIGATTRSRNAVESDARSFQDARTHWSSIRSRSWRRSFTSNSSKLETFYLGGCSTGIGEASTRDASRRQRSAFWWTRNFAASEADGRITLDVARAALGDGGSRSGRSGQTGSQISRNAGGSLRGRGPTGVEAAGGDYESAVGYLER